jgi:four helix bundle protein
MMIHDFTQFDAWKKAMLLAERMHSMTRSFPKEELYGMTSQVRRASLSIAANIAEGFGRYTAADKKHKYVQARGELIEVMTFLHHAARVGYIDMRSRDEELFLCRDIHMMLNALISKIHARQS